LKLDLLNYWVATARIRLGNSAEHTCIVIVLRWNFY